MQGHLFLWHLCGVLLFAILPLWVYNLRYIFYAAKGLFEHPSWKQTDKWLSDLHRQRLYSTFSSNQEYFNKEIHVAKLSGNAIPWATSGQINNDLNGAVGYILESEC